MSAPLAIAVVAAAGVLAPKLLPALLFPRDLHPALIRWLRYLPAATMGAFTAIIASALWTNFPASLLTLGAIATAGGVALATKRTLTSLLVGWGLLVGLHLSGMGS